MVERIDTAALREEAERFDAMMIDSARVKALCAEVEALRETIENIDSHAHEVLDKMGVPRSENFGDGATDGLYARLAALGAQLSQARRERDDYKVDGEKLLEQLAIEQGFRSESEAALERERDEARAQVAKLTEELDEARGWRKSVWYPLRDLLVDTAGIPEGGASYVEMMRSVATRLAALEKVRAEAEAYRRRTWRTESAPALDAALEEARDV